jgi:ABC-type nitrate/sulfonate/bicarbonate transport system substrate-binding protein
MGDRIEAPPEWERPIGRRRFLQASGMAALGGMLAACNSGGSKNPTTGPPATTGSATTGASTTGGASTSTPAERATVRFINDFLPGLFNFWYFVGKDAGYWEEENLDIQFSSPPPALFGDPRLVTSGRADMMLSVIPSMIFARAAGLPIISVGSTFKQRADGVIFDPKKIEITGPKDLRGKKFGNFFVPDYQAEFRQFLKSGGMAESDVTIVNIGFSSPTAVQSGQVDAGAGIFYGERVTMTLLLGYSSGWLDYRDFGVPNFPFMELVVTEDYASKNGDVIKRFLRAAAKSIKKTLTDPVAPINAFKECCVSGPTATGTIESQTVKFETSRPYWFAEGATPDTADYLVNVGSEWSDVLAWSTDIGLADKVEPPENYFTNEFITPEAEHPTI